MPVGNASVPPATADPAFDESSQQWAIPLATIRGTRWSLSYNVFVAAALVCGVIATLLARGEQPDLWRATGAGVLFWISGWAIQAMAMLGSAALLSQPTSSMRIGLLGVECPPRKWLPPRALVILISGVGSLLVLACFYRWVEGGFQIPVLAPVSEQAWRVPSLGFAAHDSLWKSGAWLICAQAVLQMFPLPRTLGRQLIAAWAAVCGRGLSLASQVLLFRRCLDALAVLTVILTLAMIASDDPTWSTKWPLVLVAGLLLWISSRREDVVRIMTGFHLAQVAVHDAHPSPPSRPWDIVGGWRERLRQRQRQRRMRRALDREHGEAVDAQRLDEILNRLHEQGPDSLSGQDRRLLQRVSENLRKQRDGELHRD